MRLGRVSDPENSDALNVAFELLRRRWKLVAWDCGRRAGRARRSWGFLCVGCGAQRSGGKKGKHYRERICFHGTPPDTCCHSDRRRFDETNDGEIDPPEVLNGLAARLLLGVEQTFPAMVLWMTVLLRVSCSSDASS
jgi:hypothetical protein